MLGKKTTRANFEIAKDTILLSIGNKKQEFRTIKSNLENAEILFEQFILIKDNRNIPNQKKFKLLKSILELCEIIPEYLIIYFK